MFKMTFAGMIAAAVIGMPAVADTINLRAIGLVSTHKHLTDIERAFYADLSKTTGMDFAVNFNPLDVVGVNMQDTMRLVRNGTFDIVETTIGSAARDDPFIEGLDLIGVSPDIETLQDTISAYRGNFSERVEQKFNAHVLGIWPFGPQMFFCKGDIKSLSDLSGKKVRSFTPTMSAFVEYLGATPVTLQFAEVYPALQRGVADCAITSPTSANTGNWPEVTNNMISLGINWSVQGHFMNLDKWNSLSPEQQTALQTAFADLEKAYWDIARNESQTAINCNVGLEPCEGYKKYNLTLVEPTDADRETVHKAISTVILPIWEKGCTANYVDCAEKWNSTIGAARGLKIH